MMTKANHYELPRLGYEYDALEPAYSSELLELHYSEHHKAYVNGANRARKDLVNARAERNFDALNELQKNLAFHVSGHHLHSILLAEYVAQSRHAAAQHA